MLLQVNWRELWVVPACIVLGLGRVVTVRAANYNEHGSEYGVHWNFFFTIAAVIGFHTALRFAASVAHVRLHMLSVGGVAVVLMALHHAALVYFGVQDLVLVRSVQQHSTRATAMPLCAAALTLLRAVGGRAGAAACTGPWRATWSAWWRGRTGRS